MTDLLSQLQRATKGNRLLDFEIAALSWPADHAKGMKQRYSEWKCDYETVPRYTTNLQDAVSLVPEGWFIAGMGEEVEPIVYVGDLHDSKGTFSAALQHRQGGMWTQESALTLPLALCIAIIKAHEPKAEAA